MSWQTIIALVIGATIPIVSNWISAMAKYHYDEKHKYNDTYKKEIRTFLLIKPHMESAKSFLMNFKDNNFNYNFFEFEWLDEPIKKLKEAPIEEIPLKILSDFYENTGSLDLIRGSHDVISSDQYGKMVKYEFKKLVIETEKSMENLINNYSNYIEIVKKKI